MPTKSELIEHLAPAIVQRTGRHLLDVRNNLNDLTLDNLEQMYQKQVAAGLVKPFQPQPDIEQLKREAREQANQELDSLREQTLRSQASAAAEMELYRLRKNQILEPQRTAEAAALNKRNRAAFPFICKELNLSECEANYLLLVQLLGEISVFSATQAVQSNAVSLVKASEAEINLWETQEKQQLAAFIAECRFPLLTEVQRKQVSAREAEEQNNSRLQRQQIEIGKLLTQDVQWLRDRAVEIQQTKQLSRLSPTELRQRINTAQTTPLYPVMPDAINYDAIKRMDSSQLRELLRKYGKEAVDARCGIQKPQPSGLVRNINEKAFLGLRA